MAVNFDFLAETANIVRNDLNTNTLQNEINAINELLSQGIKEEAGKVQIDSEKLLGLKTRIDYCITVLQKANEQLKASSAVRAARRKLKRAQESFEKEDIVKQAQEKLDKAEKALEDVKNRVAAEVTNKDIRWAISEGYAVVTLLREYITKEKIDYKIMAVGEDGGQQVILESNPSLAEVLSSSSLDTSSMSVRLVATQDQFKNILRNLDEKEKKSKIQNSVLAKMVQSQFNEDQMEKWSFISQFKEQSDNILNYGNLMESFIDYLEDDNIDKTLQDVNYIYELLQQGRNNLAYYKGPDVKARSGELWQVKTLSFYESIGRADIATLRNVLNPLIKIREILKDDLSGPKLKKALENYFTPKKGEGERSLSNKTGEFLRGVIEKALKDMEK